MWSEEKAVHPLAYDSLPLRLRKEIFKSRGVSAASWRYQLVAAYDVWLVMNAWEMAKLRTVNVMDSRLRADIGFYKAVA